jgi:hypothetical protein
MPRGSRIAASFAAQWARWQVVVAGPASLMCRLQQRTISLLSEFVYAEQVPEASSAPDPPCPGPAAGIL